MSENATTGGAKPQCPHCEQEMERWATPPDSSWGEGWQWVCFNDECPYFVKGWTWMATQFNVRSSYRFRLDPIGGGSGPLPVWSASAMRSGIITDEEAESNE